MRLADIEVGNVYLAKVDGYEEPVLVTAVFRDRLVPLVEVTLDDMDGTRTVVKPRAIKCQVDPMTRSNNM